MDNTDIAYNIMLDLKKVIHFPMFYTEIQEDGAIIEDYTEFGQSIYDIILKNLDKK